MALRFRAALAFAIAGAAAIGAAHAGNGSWTSGGPFGGEVLSLAADPVHAGTFYAGGQSFGIYRSTDSGATWSAVNAGFSTEFGVAALAVDPSNPNVVYAAFEGLPEVANVGPGGRSGFGVFRSENGGGSWIPIDTGLPARAQAVALAIDPHTSSTVYCVAAPQGEFEVPVVNSVYRSSDSGAHWTLANTGLPSANLGPRVLAIDPATTSTLYAGTGQNGVFKSVDGGAHWTPANSGIAGASIDAIAIDPVSPATIWVGSAAGVFRSTDGGMTWNGSKATALGEQAVNAIALDAGGGPTLYAATAQGVFRSVDGGGTWAAATDSGLAETTPNALLADPHVPGVVYAGLSVFGVFRSADGGAAWTSSSTGLSGMDVLIQPIAMNGTDYAVAVGLQSLFTDINGTFRSTNAGVSWTETDAGLSGHQIGALAADPNHASTLYAGIGDDVGIFRSTDAGAHWSSISTEIGSVVGLAVDPSNSSILLAGTFFGTEQSIDGGVHWSPVQSVAGQQFVYDPLHPGTVYTFGEQQAFGQYQFLRSGNSGATWNVIDNGLPGLDQSLPLNLTIDPTTPTTLYAVLGNQIFVTRNSGTSWAHLATPFSSSIVDWIEVNPRSGSEIVAATDGSGGAGGHLVFESRDGGSTWAPIDDGLTPLFTIASLTFDDDGVHLYAGTIGGSVLGIVLPAPPIPPEVRRIKVIHPPHPSKVHGKR